MKKLIVGMGIMITFCSLAAMADEYVCDKVGAPVEKYRGMLFSAITPQLSEVKEKAFGVERYWGISFLINAIDAYDSLRAAGGRLGVGIYVGPSVYGYQLVGFLPERAIVIPPVSSYTIQVSSGVMIDGELIVVGARSGSINIANKQGAEKFVLKGLKKFRSVKFLDQPEAIFDTLRLQLYIKTFPIDHAPYGPYSARSVDNVTVECRFPGLGEMCSTSFEPAKSVAYTLVDTNGVTREFYRIDSDVVNFTEEPLECFVRSEIKHVNNKTGAKVSVAVEKRVNP